MTTYTAKRNALERAINDLLCSCGVNESCAECDHLPVCAMARRTMHLINEDKRRTKHLINEDKRNDCNNVFAVWVDAYIRGLFGNDN